MKWDDPHWTLDKARKTQTFVVVDGKFPSDDVGGVFCGVQTKISSVVLHADSCWETVMRSRYLVGGGIFVCTIVFDGGGGDRPLLGDKSGPFRAECGAKWAGTTKGLGWEEGNGQNDQMTGFVAAVFCARWPPAAHPAQQAGHSWKARWKCPGFRCRARAGR